MRFPRMLMLVFGAMVSLPYQRAMADQAGQTSQLGVTVGSVGYTSIGYTRVIKLSPATDAKLKPGDYVKLYLLNQKMGFLSRKPLTRDVWIAYAVAGNVKLLAIDRSEPLDPNALYINRMVRFEVTYKGKGRPIYFDPPNRDAANLVLGLAGDPPPNICGDCDVLSAAEYRDQYGPQCSIKTRSGSHVYVNIIPCPKDE